MSAARQNVPPQVSRVHGGFHEKTIFSIVKNQPSSSRILSPKVRRRAACRTVESVGERLNISGFSAAFQPQLIKNCGQVYAEAPLIPFDRHGFIKDRARATNQLLVQKFLLDAFSSGSRVDGSQYADFPKAFDKVDHTILI